MNGYEDDWGVGNDEHEGEPVALVRSRRGRAAFFPKSISRHPDEVVEVAADLQMAAEAVREAVERVELLVWEARSAGLSWDAIGWCTGIVGRTAAVKWGELAAGPPPEARGR